MIRLKEVTIKKYKSFQSVQTVKIEDNVTVLVGMNEAGKTVLLEAIAKLNYFNPKDSKFRFDAIQDFPRKELVKFQRSNSKEEIIRARFEISSDLIANINQDLGKDIFLVQAYEYSKNYNEESSTIHGLSSNVKKYIENLTVRFKDELSAESLDAVKQASSIAGVKAIEFPDGEGENLLKEISSIIEASKWSEPLSGYIWTKYISPHQPKFWYFDDYYQLDGRVNLHDYKAGKYDSEKSKTIEALLDIAGIKIEDLLAASNFENFNAQLEAASNEISEQLFKYWSGNANLEIEFKIDKITREETRQVKVYHPSYPNQNHHAHTENVTDTFSETVLDIRVKNTTHKITLPLHRRSKGFNWFFSFVVWFSKVKNDTGSNYILLFDEPGLNLHALAQNDLLLFLEDLGKEYQVIYSTHSPFMIDSQRLHRVRTIVETNNGSVASETIQEKDPKTLFPLQAALGYDIAQNLFISKNNLLVEGPADLIYFTVLSSALQAAGRTGLDEAFTIIPVGGLDKVASFISLMRGSKLNVACILDTFTDQKGKQRLEDLIQHKIIKDKQVRFFHEFLTGRKVADIEDLFSKDDYLKIFNAAFSSKYRSLSISDLNSQIEPIVLQINKALVVERYNHYTPANNLAKMAVEPSYFSDETLKNFEMLFTEMNKLL